MIWLKFAVTITVAAASPALVPPLGVPSMTSAMVPPQSTLGISPSGSLTVALSSHLVGNVLDLEVLGQRPSELDDPE